MEGHGHEISFNRNKATILPLDNQPIYQTNEYIIFKTQFPQYYIKIYTNEEYSVNIKLAKRFSQSTTLLNKTTDYIISIYDMKEILPEVAILMENYDYNIEQMIENRLICTNLDVLKITYQLCCWIDWLKESKIEGFSLSTDNIVVDKHLNYKITHFDRDINELTQEEKKRIASDGFSKAPQFYKGEVYDSFSNI